MVKYYYDKYARSALWEKERENERDIRHIFSDTSTIMQNAVSQILNTGGVSGQPLPPGYVSKTSEVYILSDFSGKEGVSDPYYLEGGRFGSTKANMGMSVRDMFNFIAENYRSGLTLFARSSDSDKLIGFYINAFGADQLTVYLEPRKRKTFGNRGILLESDIKGDANEYPSDGADGLFWYVRKGLVNTPPTVKLTMAASSRTLYESDSYAITGTAQDADAGDVVMVKYKINNGTARTIASPVSTGAEFPFNKFLTFKEGKLFDGATAVTSTLAEGTQHVLTVWAEDDKGGKSPEVTRTFYVVPNRPPTLVVDPIMPKTDMIETDSFEVKGTVNNPDANGVKVHYKIGNGAYQEVYNSTGAGGAFSFRLTLSQLAAGANSLTIRATDAFGAVDIKTITISKSGTSLPLKTAVTRYKLTPPNGTAKGVLLWIERETGDLTVDAAISMTNAGEPESYQPMTKSATAFVREGIEEDEFTFDAVTGKTEIILKITMSRTSTASNKGITLISGVFS